MSNSQEGNNISRRKVVQGFASALAAAVGGMPQDADAQARKSPEASNTIRELAQLMTEMNLMTQEEATDSRENYDARFGLVDNLVALGVRLFSNRSNPNTADIPDEARESDHPYIGTAGQNIHLLRQLRKNRQYLVIDASKKYGERITRINQGATWTQMTTLHAPR